jgi:hypothetical protein
MTKPSVLSLHPSRPHRFLSLASLVAVTVLLATPSAQAIAPSQQRTNPAQGTSQFDVVDLLNNNNVKQVAGQNLGAETVGTGSIIGTRVVGNVGYFCILTADHNFPGSKLIGFGDKNPGAAAGTFANTFNITRNIQIGTADMDIAFARFGAIPANGPGLQFWNDVKNNTLGIWNPPNVTDAQLINYVKANVASFTQIGYGLTGNPVYNFVNGQQIGFTNPPLNTAANYVAAQAVAGVQRFQNNFPTGGTLNFGGPTYNYTTVDWMGHIPTLPNGGEGTSFRGDSGGPYLLENKAIANIAGLPNPYLLNPPANYVNQIDPNNNAQLLPQNIQYYTNTIFAVHTYGNNNNPQLYSDNLNSGGDLITSAQKNAIQKFCANANPTPEPSTCVLLGIGVVVLVSLAPRWRDR